MKTVIAVLFLLVFQLSVGSECTIKMVFKESSKYPLMAAAPDDSGIFKELYSEAANRIGCELHISRLPKQRLHVELQRGRLDFYPAASFSDVRSNYLHYIDNGMSTGEFGVSSTKLPEITNLNQLRGLKNVIWLMEMNSSKSEIASSLGIYSQQIKSVNIDKVLEFINGRPEFNYFYVADTEVIDYFEANNLNQTMSDFGLQVHPHCCGSLKPMYIGFSRFSPHVVEEHNTSYIADEILSETNQITSLVESSIAFRFKETLKKMKEDGTTEAIYKKWYSTLKP